MRRRCSKQVNEIEKLKEESHNVSGAYIRTLVKHLNSSQTKDPLNSDTQFSQQKPPQKKQVRRRHHTSRPYQERLLNMAEARREIVTALKFHRAAMKQQEANEQQKQQELDRELLKSRRNPTTYASNPTSDNFPSYVHNFSRPPPQYLYSYPIPSLTHQENLNFPLPNQTLGLNLNFHDFNNLDTTSYFTNNLGTNNNNPSIYPSSSSSSTSPPIGLSEGADKINSGLHQVMDDKEMAEIRSIGEQHEMEWNDTLNFVTSAWWFKFLKTMEIGPGGEDYGCYPFHEVMEFPVWLNNANESGLSDDTYSEGYFRDPGLPCMDIEEIEGTDVEWLA